MSTDNFLSHKALQKLIVWLGRWKGARTHTHTHTEHLLVTL